MVSIGFRATVLVLDAGDLGEVPGARYLRGADVSGAIDYHVPEAWHATETSRYRHIHASKALYLDISLDDSSGSGALKAV